MGNPELEKFALDGNVYQTYAKTSDDPMQWPFNKPFYVIMNMAVGGDWGGLKGIDKDAFRGGGQTMEIDWVSVEQKEWPIPVPIRGRRHLHAFPSCVSFAQRH